MYERTFTFNARQCSWEDKGPELSLTFPVTPINRDAIFVAINDEVQDGSLATYLTEKIAAEIEILSIAKVLRDSQ